MRVGRVKSVEMVTVGGLVFIYVYLDVVINKNQIYRWVLRLIYRCDANYLLVLPAQCFCFAR